MLWKKWYQIKRLFVIFVSPIPVLQTARRKDTIHVNETVEEKLYWGGRGKENGLSTQPNTKGRPVKHHPTAGTSSPTCTCLANTLGLKTGIPAPGHRDHRLSFQNTETRSLFTKHVKSSLKLNLCNMFTPKISSNDLHYAKQKLSLRKPRTEYLMRSFSYGGDSLSKELPEELGIATS